MHERLRLVFSCVVVGVISGLLFLSSADATDSEPDSDFQRAADLMESGRFAEAILLLDRVLIAYPGNASALWNLGIATAETGEHSRALDTWKRYEVVTPDDWRVRAKLVQSYQALGRVEERDTARRDLLRHWKEVLSKSEKAPPYYCREQFQVAGRRVMALEYFEPAGPRKVFYRFSVLRPSGQEAYFISLGSYDDTTEIARELGEIRKNQRVYHLDKYDGGVHSTIAFFHEQPTYDRVRLTVVSILEGTRVPVSGSRKTSP